MGATTAGWRVLIVAGFGRLGAGRGMQGAAAAMVAAGCQGGGTAWLAGLDTEGWGVKPRSEAAGECPRCGERLRALAGGRVRLSSRWGEG